jgi:iron complex outermembrane recepter protein
MYYLLRGRLLTTGFILTSVTCAWAQPSTETSSASTTEPVRLSEFMVRENADNSYIASESVTGTRVRTPIKDLTFNVSVITSEFLNDFAYFEIDNLGYTSTISGFDNGGGNVNMRGYGATSFLRNGFLRLGLIDRVNIDRIEVIRGPSATIYGMTTPAGMINIITRRPKYRPEQRLFAATGSYRTNRDEVTIAGPIGSSGKNAYTFSWAESERRFEQQFTNTNTKTASLAFEHKFSDHSSIMLELEWLGRHTNPVQAVPYFFNPTTKRYAGFATELMTFSQNGPHSEQNRDISTINLTYENRLSDVWSVRSSVYRFHRHSLTFSNGASVQFDPVKRQILGRTVSKGWINEDGGGFQNDVLASYHLWHGKLAAKTLFTLDHSQYWKYNPTKQLPNSVNANPAFYAATLNVDAPDYRVPEFAADVYTNLSRKLVSRVDVEGALLRQQVSTVDNRLIAVAGLRYDYAIFNFWDKAAAAASPSSPTSIVHFVDKQFSPMVGINYKVASHAALYANRTNSFTPNAQRASASLNANETAHGVDYGVKCDFFEDRLQFTIGGYYINRIGVTVTDVNAAGQQVTTSSGNQNSKGLEFDGTWRVSDSLTVLAGYGHVNARIVSNGRDTDSIGRAPAKVPVDNLGVALKYNFKGALKGLAATAGVTYTGPNFPDSTTGGTADKDGVIRSNDGRRDIALPGFTTIDAGISYSHRAAGSHFSHSVQVNVKNLTDKIYISTQKVPGDRRAVYASYTLKH